MKYTKEENIVDQHQPQASTPEYDPLHNIIISMVLDVLDVLDSRLQILTSAIIS